MNYDIMRFPKLCDKAVTLSYDDGVVYDEKLIDIINTYGLKATFNINTGSFGEGIRLNKQQVLKLYSNSGHEIAVHGKKHLNLINFTKEEIIYEISEDRKELEKMFGTDIRGMAYAYGKYNDLVVDTLKELGICYSRTVNPSEGFNIPTDWLRLYPTCHHNHSCLMSLAKSFIENVEAKPKLFYLWGHSYEFNNNDNWNVIEEFAKYIGGREDVWYATNIQVYEYVKAFESLIFSYDRSMVKNPSAVTVYLSIGGKDYTVLPGETVALI